MAGQGGAGVRVTRRGEVGAKGAGPWGAGVRVTGQGRVGAERAGPEVGAEDAGLVGVTPNRQGVRSGEEILPDLQSRRDGGGVVLYLH